MGLGIRRRWRLSVIPLVSLAVFLSITTPGSRLPQGRGPAGGTAQGGGASGGAHGPWNLGAHSPAGAAAAPAARYVEGEILVRFKDHVRPEQAKSVRAGINGVVHRRFRHGAEQLKLGKNRTVEEAVAWLNKHPLVEYAEPNYLIQAEAVPDDLLFGQQYGLDNTGQDGGIIGADIDAVEAWETATGSQDVLVAVIDSGIDVGHPDLADNIWINPDEIPGNGLDDDGNGYIDDVRGWDFIMDSAFPEDPFGHGTHVSGIIGAVGNNGIGIAGVSWKVSLVNVRFLGNSGTGSTADGIAAIEYATALGVDIINASWGGREDSQGLYDAITAAGDAGILFVAAAGNSNSDLDRSPYYPAAWDHEHMISVAATNFYDNRWVTYYNGSNYGVETVDLGAPGFYILSTVPVDYFGKEYDYGTGTSMAAPHVTGAAALLRSTIPGITATSIKKLLLDSVDPLPALMGRTVSGGRLNIRRALEDPDEVPPGSILDLAVGEITTNTVELRWTATGDDGDEGTATSYDVRFATQPIDAQNFAVASRFASQWQVSPPGTADGVIVGGLDPATTYWFAVRALDEWGNAGAISNGSSAGTLGAPTLAYSPSEAADSLFQGQIRTLQVVIQNTGEGTLDWQFPAPLLSMNPEGTILLPAAGDPSGGRLWAGESQEVSIMLDASTANPGLYSGDLVLLSNDPLLSEVLIPLSLTVQGAPILGTDLQYIEFGQLFAGRARGIDLLVSNTGTELLEVTDVQVSDPALSALPETLLVAPGETQGLQVFYAPHAAGVLDALLILNTNSPVSPEMHISVTGSAILPPQLVVASPDLSADLFSGETTTLPLILTNTGDSDLTIALAQAPTPAGTEPVLEWDGLPKGAEQASIPGPGREPSLRRMDRHGYSFSDSNAAGGPRFEWVDISEEGQLIDLTQDDALSAPLAIGFDFPFYGVTHASARICSNGWLSFSDHQAAWSNPTQLPARGDAAPGNLIAPFFDDLDLDGDQRIYTLATGTRFIVQYSQVRRFGRDEEFSFQTILEPDGRVLFQYLSVPADASATVGIQNADSSDGLLVSANDGYLSAGLAVEVQPPPIVVNGSFETGSFSPWRITRSNTSSSLGWKVRTAGDGWYLNLAPVDGIYNIQNDFDGPSNLEYTLSQNITIPTGLVSAELSYYDRIQFEDFSNRGWVLNPMTHPKIYEATVRDLSDNILEVITRLEIYTTGAPYTDLGPQRRSVELAPYAGQTVKIHIRQFGQDPYTGPVSMEYDAFRVDVERRPGWYRLPVQEAVISPGESMTFEVFINPGPRESGVFRSGLRIASNDPQQSEVVLPVTLNVTSAPDISLLGERVAFTSEECFEGQEARTNHEFILESEPAGNMALELTRLSVPYFYYDAMSTLFVEERELGSVGVDWYPGQDTPPGVFPITHRDMTDLSIDGVVKAWVLNEWRVRGYGCPDANRVGLSYNEELQELDFGSLFIGESREVELQILNSGSLPLEISGMASDRAEFQVVALPGTLAAGETGIATLRFAPLSASEILAVLTINSNDPDEPALSLQLMGTGLEPPVPYLDASSLQATLNVGSSEHQILTLENQGGNPLVFSTGIEPEGATIVSVEPATGSVAPFSTQELTVTMNAIG